MRSKLSIISFAWFLILTIFLSPLTPLTAFAGENSWTALPSIDKDCCSQIKTFTVDPHSSTTLYAGVELLGLYKSIDSGQNWRHLTADLPQSLTVSEISIAPDASNVVFLGTDKGVFRSEDGGDTWNDVTASIFSTVGNTNRNIQTIAISPNFTIDHTVFLNINYGKVGALVFRTTDSGKSWQTVGSNPAFDFASDIAISPAYSTDHTVFFTGGGTAYKSTDGGLTMKPLSLPSGEAGGNIALSPAYSSDHTIFVGGLAVHKSIDSGLTWVKSIGEPGRGYFVAISPKFSENKAVFISVSNVGVFRSFGGEAPWTPVNDGLSDHTSGELQFAGEQRLIINTSLSGLWSYTFTKLQLPSAPVSQPVGSNPNVIFFPETKHTLAFGFKNFWQGNGALAVFGFPLTEEFNEVNADTGKVYTVQYFERQRFEYHPENAGTPYEVLLGRLGVAEAQQRNLLNSASFQATSAGNDQNCTYFPITGHKVCGTFRVYWQSHGLDFNDSGTSFRESLALFGYPISEEFNQDGRIVQYFERAVFEYHSENSAPYNVLLRRLSADTLTQRGW